MTTPQKPHTGAGYIPVIVRPEPAGRYTARPVGIPEIAGEGGTPEEAIEQMRTALEAWTGTVYWVPTERGPAQGLSLLDFAGYARDDPFHEEYLEEIRRYRREVDERECSNSSSTPTT